MASHFFVHYDSSSNLAKSRYPFRGQGRWTCVMKFWAKIEKRCNIGGGGGNFSKVKGYCKSYERKKKMNTESDLKIHENWTELNRNNLVSRKKESFLIGGILESSNFFPGHFTNQYMHICPCSLALEICKNIGIRTCFGSVTAEIMGVFRHLAFCSLGNRLASFFFVPKSCIFWGASFELMKNLATLFPKKSQGFHGTLLYHCYTLAVSGVRAPKDLWEGNGNSHSHNSDTLMGTGREPGIFLWKKIWQHQPAIFFLRIASESEKVFARILDEFFRFFYLPKISVFSGQTIQNFKTLTPPLTFWNWESCHSLPKKCSWWW